MDFFEDATVHSAVELR